jgi:hypothetical protein
VVLPTNRIAAALSSSKLRMPVLASVPRSHCVTSRTDSLFTDLQPGSMTLASGISPGVRAFFRSQRALTSERLPFGSAHMECYGQTHIGRERELVLCGNVQLPHSTAVIEA